MLIKKILCPVDLGEHSPEVAKYAVAIASAMKAEVEILYVAPSFEEYATFQTPADLVFGLVENITAEAHARLNAFVSEHFKDVPTSAQIVNGYVADEILKEAEKLPADLIIMATHGRRGLDRLVFGSVAEKVIKASLVPVMTIRPE